MVYRCLHMDMAPWEWNYVNRFVRGHRLALWRLVQTPVAGAVLWVTSIALISTAWSPIRHPRGSDTCYGVNVTYVAGVTSVVVLLLSTVVNAARLVHTTGAVNLPSRGLVLLW